MALRRTSIRVPFIAAASCAIAVTVFGVGARDDPYITFWVAEQLAKTGRIVNINGARIEQSSSLAHVVLLAVLYLVSRAPLPVLSYLVGLASLAGTVVLSSRVARRISPGAELTTAVVVALAFPIVYWATGLLETDLAALSVLWFLLAWHALLTRPHVSARAGVNYAGSALLMVTVRPDTMFVGVLATFVVAAVALAARMAPTSVTWRAPVVDLRRALAALAVVDFAVVVVTAYREIEFHSLLPQPENVKVGGLTWIGRGFSYLFSSLPYWMWLVVLVPAVAGLVWCATRQSVMGLVAVSVALAGCVVIIVSRGDWMGGARLLVPYLAPLLVLSAVGTGWLTARWRWAAVLAIAGVECLAMVLFANGASWLSSKYVGLNESPIHAASADFGSPFGSRVVDAWSTSLPSVNLPWYDSWAFPGTRDSLFLAAATPIVRQLVSEETPGQMITVASNQAGYVFYTWANDFPGKLEFIDTESIATESFPHCSGLEESFAGDLMTIPRWSRDAGHCAPPLPDLYFTPSTSQQTRGIAIYYHVIASIHIKYLRNGLGTTNTLYGTEFLAERDGWSP
jgi:hypothetical protein